MDEWIGGGLGPEDGEVEDCWGWRWWWKDGGLEERGDLRISGPSDSAIPSALPPFLEKYEITFLLMGCKVMAGRTCGTALMWETSSVYMERIS